MFSNYSDQKGVPAKKAELLDGFDTPAAEHANSEESPKTGLLLFSFGRRGGFSKPGDDSRSANVAS